MRPESLRSTEPLGPDWRKGSDGWWYSPLWLGQHAEQQHTPPATDRAALRRRIIRLRLTIGGIIAMIVLIVGAITISNLTGEDPTRCARIAERQQQRAAESYDSPDFGSPTLPPDLVQLNQQLLDCSATTRTGN